MNGLARTNCNNDGVIKESLAGERQAGQGVKRLGGAASRCLRGPLACLQGAIS